MMQQSRLMYQWLPESMLEALSQATLSLQHTYASDWQVNPAL